MATKKGEQGAALCSQSHTQHIGKVAEYQRNTVACQATPSFHPRVGAGFTLWKIAALRFLFNRKASAADNILGDVTLLVCCSEKP